MTSLPLPGTQGRDAAFHNTRLASMMVPSHLINEGADLSERYHVDPPLTFEELFIQEASLTRCAGASDEYETLSNHFDDDDSMMSSSMPSSLPALPRPEVEQHPGRHAGPDGVSEQDLVLEAERRDSIVDEMKPIAPPRTLLPRRGKTSQKVHGLRVSDKKNLTLTEIPIVADRLISQDAVSSFLCHCPSFYEYWMPCSAQQPLSCNKDIETSVVAAFDRVHDLLKDRRNSGLLLRFAYIHLTWVIEAYKTVAATYRIEGKVSRNVGHGDATVAIDLYLDMKRRSSGEEIKRSQVSANCRTGRRWVTLTGRSPLLAFVFSPIADTIV